VSGIGAPPRCSVVAEDIRDLQRWTAHGRGLLRRRLLLPALPGLLVWPRRQVERALDAGDHAGGDAGAARRRVQFVVTQKHLDLANIGTVLQQVDREAVAQRCSATAFLIPAASADSWNRRLSWRVDIGLPRMVPGNDQRSSNAVPAHAPLVTAPGSVGTKRGDVLCPTMQDEDDAWNGRIEALGKLREHRLEKLARAVAFAPIGHELRDIARGAQLPGARALAAAQFERLREAGFCLVRARLRDREKKTALYS
jgi:hypothetical protein